MHRFIATALGLFSLARLSAGALVAQESPLVLASPRGAEARFEAREERWTWTQFLPPGSSEARAVEDMGSAFAAGGTADRLAPEWTLVPQDDPAKLVFEQETPLSGLRFRRIFSFGNAAAVLRIETQAQAIEGERELTRAGLLDVRIAGEPWRETGPAPASFPLFGRTLFAGIEHVSGIARAEDDIARFAQTPHAKIGAEWTTIAKVVIGWAGASDCTLLAGEARLRDAFLQYLDTVRVKPADLELHTNTWWSLPLPFNEGDVLRHIEALRRGFQERTGMFFDSFALDLGWSDPKSVWRIDAKNFPNGFRTLNDRLGALGARLGLWISPGSAYPEGLDNNWLASNGYEVVKVGNPGERLQNIACFALGGRYQREFKDRIVGLAQEYGLRHVKLDFMAHTCDVAAHGHPTGYDSWHAIDAGLADVLDSLRAVNPAMVLEPLCTGYPSSPWWLLHTPYVLGPYGDDVPPGRVPALDWMESLITARDIAYRTDQERWLMPTQALETIDIVVQSPGEFENLAVMAIGRGRSFLSTYLKPELMTPENWDFLAGVVRWARANRSSMVNALQIGGRPENREAYGYLFHNVAKDIVCARNPWIEERTIDVPVCATLTEPRELRMIFPHRQTLARLEPGTAAVRVALAPYETVLLETVAPTYAPIAAPPEAPTIALQALDPAVVPVFADDESAPALHYSWGGTLEVSGGESELCILVEGTDQVANASGMALVGNRYLALHSSGSAGQFFAAAQPGAEHWQWLTVRVPAGLQSVQVELDLPLESASVGIFLRGAVDVADDPAPETGAVFPVSRHSQRGWSRTLVPLKTYSINGDIPDAAGEEP